MDIFPEGICDLCGRSGKHPDCRKAAELERRYQGQGAVFLRKYALHGQRGVYDE